MSSDMSKMLGEGLSDRPFALQFTSLMLMLLTFIIGVFSSYHIAKKPEATPMTGETVGVQDSPPAMAQDIGLTKFQEMFAERADGLNEGMFEAMLTVLRAHDVDAAVYVYGGESGDFSLALARGMSLSRRLGAENLPAGAVSVIASPRAVSDAQVAIKWSTVTP